MASSPPRPPSSLTSHNPFFSFNPIQGQGSANSNPFLENLSTSFNSLWTGIQEKLYLAKAYIEGDIFQGYCGVLRTYYKPKWMGGEELPIENKSAIAIAEIARTIIFSAERVLTALPRAVIGVYRNITRTLDDDIKDVAEVFGQAFEYFTVDEDGNINLKNENKSYYQSVLNQAYEKAKSFFENMAEKNDFSSMQDAIFKIVKNEHFDLFRKEKVKKDEYEKFFQKQLAKKAYEALQERFIDIIGSLEIKSLPSVSWFYDNLQYFHSLHSGVISDDKITESIAQGCKEKEDFSETAVKLMQKKISEDILSKSIDELIPTTATDEQGQALSLDKRKEMFQQGIKANAGKYAMLQVMLQKKKLDSFVFPANMSDDVREILGVEKKQKTRVSFNGILNFLNRKSTEIVDDQNVIVKIYVLK